MRLTGFTMAVAALLPSGCDKIGGASDKANFNRPQTVCYATSTLATLKSILFDNARAVRRGFADASTPALRFDDFERQSKLTIDQVVLDGHDTAIQRITCKGRIEVTPPVGLAEMFEREAMQADVTYTVQPMADETGSMVAVDGARELISRLAVADLSGWLTATTLGAGTGPTVPIAGLADPASFAPEVPTEPATAASFDCTASLTRIETIVCSNEILRRKDRQMARRFGDYVATLSEYGARAVRIDQRDWLARRDTCDDPACVADSYDERLAAIANSN